MGLSDCPKCWDTLCSCGWEYRNWDRARREDLAASALGVSLATLRTAVEAPEKHPLLEEEKWRNTWPPGVKAIAENSPTPRTDKYLGLFVAMPQMFEEMASLESELQEAQAKVEYARSVGLLVGTGTSTDCPEGRLQHDFAEGSELRRIFDEWSHSIGWENQLAKVTAELEEAQKYIATGRSWNSPDSLLAEIDRLKLELAEARETLRRHEEEEANLCPEDRSWQETLQAAQAEHDKVLAQNNKLVAALLEIAGGARSWKTRVDKLAAEALDSTDERPTTS